MQCVSTSLLSSPMTLRRKLKQLRTSSDRRKYIKSISGFLDSKPIEQNSSPMMVTYSLRTYQRWKTSQWFNSTSLSEILVISTVSRLDLTAKENPSDMLLWDILTLLMLKSFCKKGMLISKGPSSLLKSSNCSKDLLRVDLITIYILRTLKRHYKMSILRISLKSMAS